MLRSSVVSVSFVVCAFARQARVARKMLDSKSFMFDSVDRLRVRSEGGVGVVLNERRARSNHSEGAGDNRKKKREVARCIAFARWINTVLGSACTGRITPFWSCSIRGRLRSSFASLSRRSRGIG